MHRILNKHVVQLVASNPSPMTASGTNCYLVGSGVRRTLVDTGSPGAGQSCNEALEAYQRENGKVELERIICTHWHPDHTGGISDILSKRPKCPTLKHRRLGYTVGREYPGAGEFLPSGNKYEQLNEDDFTEIVDEQVIRVDSEVNLRVKYAPGHADDHVCLLLETPNVSALFSGDNILGGTTAVFDNYTAYMNSLHQMRDFLPKDVPIFPGHGEIIEQGHDRIDFYIQHRLEREHQILTQLESTSLSIAELVDAIYVGLDDRLIPAASINVMMTLDKFEVDGAVEETKDGWKLVN